MRCEVERSCPSTPKHPPFYICLIYTSSNGLKIGTEVHHHMGNHASLLTTHVGCENSKKFKFKVREGGHLWSNYHLHFSENREHMLAWFCSTTLPQDTIYNLKKVWHALCTLWSTHVWPNALKFIKNLEMLEILPNLQLWCLCGSYFAYKKEN